MNTKMNKKGFTLTELIVVIVIIGILAVVLIPVLTGYISTAKEGAATKEAQTYVTYYATWKEETSAKGEVQDLDSFREYCVKMGMVSEEEAVYTVLSMDVAEQSFIVKASNGLYVKYTAGKDGGYEVFKEIPVDEMKDTFFESVIKPNLAYINNSESLKGVAQLTDGGVAADGSINIEVKILDGGQKATDVVDAVYEVINIIKEAGGTTAFAYPVINGLSLDEYVNSIDSSKNIDEMYMDITSIGTLGTTIAMALTYDGVSDMDTWMAKASNVLSTNTLEDLVDMNVVKVIANVQQDPNNAESMYQVVYNFDFVK